MSEILMDEASETLSPQPYNNSSMARSRHPVHLVMSTESIIDKTSSIDKTEGRYRPIFGGSMPSHGLSVMSPSIWSHPKKDRRELSIRACVRLEMASSADVLVSR